MGNIPTRPEGPIDNCCEAINLFRTLFTENVAITINDLLEAVGKENLQIKLDLIHKIKTAAFDAFDELEKIDPDFECCLAAAELIWQIASLTLIILINFPEIENLLKFYLKSLKLILKAAQSCDPECCLGVIGGLRIFWSQGLTENVDSQQIDVVAWKLLKALHRLLKKGRPECCEAAGKALGLISVGILNIIQNLNGALEAGLFGEDREPSNPTFQCILQEELKTYHKLLSEILDLSRAKCVRCCKEVVLAIGEFYSQLGRFYNPQGLLLIDEKVVRLYQVYLNLVIKIRNLALFGYEIILDRATKKECCQAVASGLAGTTLAFLNALEALFVKLANQLPPDELSLEDARKLLISFAKEYPPLAKQIISGVEPEESCSSSTKRCSSSSFSSSSFCSSSTSCSSFTLSKSSHFSSSCDPKKFKYGHKKW